MRLSPFQRPALHPPLRARRPPRPASLLVISGESSLFKLGSILVDRVHVPLFETHFGSPRPSTLLREILAELLEGSRRRGAGRFGFVSTALATLASDLRVAGPDPAWSPTAAAIDTWLGLAGSPATLALEATVAARHELGRRLAPVLAWSRALDRRLAHLPDLPLWPGLAGAREGFPPTMEVVAVGTLPEPLVARCWLRGGARRPLARIWDDRGSSRVPLVAAHVGRARFLDPAERVLASRFPGHRVLVVGSAPADLALARSLGAGFHPLRRGSEDEDWRFLLAELLPAFARGQRVLPSGRLAAFLAGG